MSGGFAQRKVALFVAEARQTRLQVQRQRVVNLAADLTVGEVLPQSVPPRRANDVLMEDMAGARIVRPVVLPAAMGVIAGAMGWVVAAHGTPTLLSGIAGGAAYDGLIAVTARHYGYTLLTADRRAAPTYAALRAETRRLGGPG